MKAGRANVDKFKAMHQRTSILWVVGFRFQRSWREPSIRSTHILVWPCSRMLAGSPFPSLDQLHRIAEKLDVSFYYLLGVQEPSYRELSPDAARIADAYSRADPVVQDVVKYLLVKK